MLGSGDFIIMKPIMLICWEQNEMLHEVKWAGDIRKSNIKSKYAGVIVNYLTWK